MTETAKLIVIAATFFFLMIGSWAAILEVLPHFGTDYILDAKFLWNTVASMRMLPGTKHALSEGLGVAERWKDFLGEHGADEYRKAIHDLKAQTVAGDNRYYANLGKK
ncbi:hypothetical protein NDA11_003850 [Ustilago hordei]|nr:hypothetical protein NDA11_003850 [Ustilago hordei]